MCIRDRAGYINPALRSRCAEIYFEPLTPQHIQKIVLNAAEKLEVNISSEIAALISEYTIEGRKAINILADAYSLALQRGNHTAMSNVTVSYTHLPEVTENTIITAIITPIKLSPTINPEAKSTPWRLQFSTSSSMLLGLRCSARLRK